MSQFLPEILENQYFQMVLVTLVFLVVPAGPVVLKGR